MRAIAVINQKGGVGKTTTVTNLGAALAARGRRVLLIDLDPQTHLTLSVNVEPAAERPSIYDVLTDRRPLDDLMQPVGENIWLVGSHINLAAAEMELVSVVGREIILRDALNRVAETYDFVFIDCPPSLGLLTVNALTAAREVFVPLQPHFLALQGVGKLFETVTVVRDRLNPELAVTGILLCMHEAGTRLAAEVVDDVRQFLDAARGTDVPWKDAQIFKTVIRRNIKLAECPSHGLTIFDYEPRSNGARDYAALAAEILGEPVEDNQTTPSPLETSDVVGQPEPAGQETTAAAGPNPGDDRTEATRPEVVARIV
jgi:chromosome partitioning protein